jgi:hypothetical protein
MLEDAERFWLSCDDPVALLRALYPMPTHGSVRPQTRQSRLYLAACARRQWARLPRACRILVSLAESVADAGRNREPLRAAAAGVAAALMNPDTGPEDFRRAESALEEAGVGAELELARRRVGSDAPRGDPLPTPWQSLGPLIYLPLEVNTPPYQWVDPDLHSVELLREVYGNPYRLLPFAPAWRTSTATTLARQMYDSGDFGAMPILADALQDAGCDDGAILDHCRDANQLHVRGCWVLDHVLKLR